MGVPDRRAMLDRDHARLSIRQQCELLGIARSGAYRPPRAANDNDLGAMRWIDELFTLCPFLGSRRLALKLRDEGHTINRKRVQRLIRRIRMRPARWGLLRWVPSRARASRRRATRPIPTCCVIW